MSYVLFLLIAAMIVVLTGLALIVSLALIVVCSSSPLGDRALKVLQILMPRELRLPALLRIAWHPGAGQPAHQDSEDTPPPRA